MLEEIKDLENLEKFLEFYNCYETICFVTIIQSYKAFVDFY